MPDKGITTSKGFRDLFSEKLEVFGAVLGLEYILFAPKKPLKTFVCENYTNQCPARSEVTYTTCVPGTDVYCLAQQHFSWVYVTVALCWH